MGIARDLSDLIIRLEYDNSNVSMIGDSLNPLIAAQIPTAVNAHVRTFELCSRNKDTGRLSPSHWSRVPWDRATKKGATKTRAMAIVSMKRPHRAGPTLPPELLERVKEEGDHLLPPAFLRDANTVLGKISSKPKHLHSRKDVRKQERQAKKQRKGVYHDLKRLGRKTIIDEPTRPVPSHPKKRPAAGASEGESATKKRRISLNDAIDPSTNVPSKSSRTSKLIPADACTQKCPEKSSKRLAPTIDDILPSINLMPEERDDKEITRLEYLLGLSKKGIRRKDSIAPNYGAEFADDGLDGVSALLFSSLSNSRLVDPDLLMDADRILAGSVS